jgi:UDP-N-acetylmuramate dehydrogenase
MWKNDLRKSLTCPLEEKKELASMSTMGVGGRGEFFVEPTTPQDVCVVFQLCVKENFPLYILGGGSNVVFTDGDLEGVVLSTRRLNGFRWDAGGDYAVLDAEAGYPLSRVFFDTAKEGFTGAEFAQGIPGTVGGAIAGNAGAGGTSMGDLLEEVTTLESDGVVRKCQRGEIGYSYRHFPLFSEKRSQGASVFAVFQHPDRFLLSCRMGFQRAPYAEIEKKAEIFRRARTAQPHGVKSAGCAFKNPPGASAGRLLELSGCKGLRVGRAVVSEAHANFLLNEGGATGADIFNLMQTCRDIVLQRTGIVLEPEIKLLGFRG